MAVANVVLQIGSKLGPGGFASLKSGIDLVVKFAGAVIDAAKDLDRFAVVMRNVDMSLVNYADSAAKGQVNTINLMKKINEFRIAGQRLTKEELAAMSKAATDLAQRTGEDATEAFERLSDSIIRGTREGLIPFGIQIDENKDKSISQRDALNKVTQAFGDLEIRLQSNTERMYALKNSAGTLISSLYEGATSGDGIFAAVFDAMNEKLSKAVDIITTMDDKTKNYAFSWDNVWDKMRLSTLELEDQLGIMSDLARTEMEMIQNRQRMLSQRGAGPDFSGASGISSAASSSVSSIASGVAQDTKRKSSRSGGRKKEFVPDEMTFSEIETEYGVYADPNVVEKYWNARKEVNEKILDGMQELSDADLYNKQLSWDSAKARHEWEMQSAQELADMNKKAADDLFEQNERQFEQDLRYYGLRDQAIEQVMALDNVERERVLHNLQDADMLVTSVNRLSAAWGTTKSAIMGVSDAYEKGTEGMTRAGAAFFYIDGIINIAKETAAAIASAASYDYFSAALHTGAAISYGVQVGLAAAHGGGSGAGGGVKPAPITATAGRYSGGYARTGEGESKETTVIVSIDPTAVAMGVLVDASERAGRAGERSFALAG